MQTIIAMITICIIQLSMSIMSKYPVSENLEVEEKSFKHQKKIETPNDFQLHAKSSLQCKHNASHTPKLVFFHNRCKILSRRETKYEESSLSRIYILFLECKQTKRKTGPSHDKRHASFSQYKQLSRFTT